MSDVVILASITLVGTIFTAVFTYLTKLHLQRVAAKVDGYSKQVDGMKTELVEAVRGRALSEGKEKGAADNQAATDAKEQDKK